MGLCRLWLRFFAIKMKHDTNDQSKTDGAPQGEPTGVPDFEPFTPVPEGDTFLVVKAIEELRARADKADELSDRFLRLSADFDNYKKRIARETQDTARYANQALLEKLLPVMDNFEMALVAMNAPNAKLESLRTGVNMIHTQFKGVLGDSGLQEIDALNQAFDPNQHEAVSDLATADVPEGHVAQQLRKGYRLRDRMIRPATVVVARKPSA